MQIRRLVAVVGAAAFVFAGCTSAGSPAPSGGAGGSQAAAGCKVGVSWNNFKEERWAKWDEPSIKDVVEKAGGSYTGTDAGSSAEKQATDVEWYEQAKIRPLSGEEMAALAALLKSSALAGRFAATAAA